MGWTDNTAEMDRIAAENENNPVVKAIRDYFDKLQTNMINMDCCEMHRCSARVSKEFLKTCETEYVRTNGDEKSYQMALLGVVGALANVIAANIQLVKDTDIKVKLMNDICTIVEQFNPDLEHYREDQEEEGEDNGSVDNVETQEIASEDGGPSVKIVKLSGTRSKNGGIPNEVMDVLQKLLSGDAKPLSEVMDGLNKPPKNKLN